MNRPPDTWSSEATDFAVWIVSRWITRQIAVASLSRVVTTAAAAKVTNGSITSKYCWVSSIEPGSVKRRVTGMCECSATHSDSKPRSSSATANSAGDIEYSVKKIDAPNSMTRCSLKSVIPAKAGTHRDAAGAADQWIPASAGMTRKE